MCLFAQHWFYNLWEFGKDNHEVLDFFHMSLFRVTNKLNRKKKLVSVPDTIPHFPWAHNCCSSNKNLSLLNMHKLLMVITLWCQLILRFHSPDRYGSFRSVPFRSDISFQWNHLVRILFYCCCVSNKAIRSVETDIKSIRSISTRASGTVV